MDGLFICECIISLEESTVQFMKSNLMVSRPRLSPQDTLSTFFFVNYSVITTLEDQISSIQNQPATHLPPCVALGLHFSAAYTFFIFSTWKITTLQWHIKYNQEAFQGTHTGKVNGAGPREPAEVHPTHQQSRGS